MIEGWLNDDNNLLQEVLRLPEEDAGIVLSDEIMSISDVIEDSEEMGCAIAETNACGFEIYETSVTAIGVDEDRLLITFEFFAEGEQIDDKPFCGTKLRGGGVAALDAEGELELEEIGASRVDDMYDEEF